MKGRCLCGRVGFEISGELPRLYQCHCSLCRRVTGSSANAAMIVDHEQFEWLRGAELVREYATETDYKSHFCSHCGSPLPNPTRDDSAWWVPVGLLDDSGELELAMHLYVDSKAGWDTIPNAGEQHAEMPDRDTLVGLLRPGKSV